MINLQVSTDLYSRDDLMRAVADSGVANPGYIGEKTLKNGAVCVRYWVWSTRAAKWVVGCTLVSLKAILKAKYTRTVERARAVEFATLGVTTSGHTTDGITCDCPNYGSKFALFVGGQKICKHTIAYAKQFWGCSTLSDMLTARAF